MPNQPNARIIHGVQERFLESWEKFLKAIMDEFLEASSYIYRGQSDYQWPLESTIDRLERQFPKRKNLSGCHPEYFLDPPLSDEQQLHAFRNAVRGRLSPAQTRIDSEDNELWALGQHHGLATPLLDWTLSPFVALFFAFEDRYVRLDPETIGEPEFRGVYALSSSAIEDPITKPQESAEIVSPKSYPSPRLLSQGGIFLKMPRRSNLESYVREHFGDDQQRPILVKFRIPNNDRVNCLAAMDKMNINRMSLFPDLDGAAAYINSIWEPGRETLLPFV